MVEDTGAELVKWEDAYTTESKQRELPNAAAVLAARWGFLRRTDRGVGDSLDADSGGECTTATAGGDTSNSRRKHNASQRDPGTRGRAGGRKQTPRQDLQWACL